MDIEELKAKVLNLISLKQEGSYWDFKREWYSFDCNDFFVVFDLFYIL